MVFQTSELRSAVISMQATSAMCSDICFPNILLGRLCTIMTCPCISLKHYLIRFNLSLQITTLTVKHPRHYWIPSGEMYFEALFVLFR